MTETDELYQKLQVKLAQYKVAKAKLEAAKDDSATLLHIAQEANESWLEYKKVEEEFSNHSFMKKVGDLYGG